MRSHAVAVAVAIAMLGQTCVAYQYHCAPFVKTLRSKRSNGAIASPIIHWQRQNSFLLTMRRPISLFGPSALCMAEERDYTSPMRQRPRPEGGDVAYTNENILRQLRYYNDMREVGGNDCVQDIYARDPNTSGEDINYWFIAKVARCTGTVSPEAAIARQLNLIEEHACRIRPVELGRHFGNLEFYAAPGDTELLTSQNDPRIRLVKVPREVEGSEKVPLLEVGLNLELVTNQGLGFCIVRTEDGVVPPHLIG